MNLCIAPFFYGLKGLVFFLAEEQKTALCVSVISLPGLAAKPASAAPSVELAPRSQCHTERAASQTTENWLYLCQTVYGWMAVCCFLTCVFVRFKGVRTAFSTSKPISHNFLPINI